MTFWEHLDELRGVLLRCMAVVFVASVAAFCFKDMLFEFLLAPGEDSFVTYSLLPSLTGGGPAHVDLINTALAGQFTAHLQAAMCVGVLVASPYLLYSLFMFVSPGLYAEERRAARMALVPAYMMFFIGMAVSYLLIFPLTFRFLGTYQVATTVTNMISLESYMSTLIVMSLTMGAVFELPVAASMLARAGIIDAGGMRRYRRQAIVAILIVAAVITPTSDVFTLLAVSMPIYLLYEASIFLAWRFARRADVSPG
ncbi:MAG: twin-arginine translocase subunit TatC [Pseudoflavonifractor sp.]|nr:twin-arginine translocase subunit TatC [Alloprevotella sp.]MCM1116219.1 twin-arginine translocase subunit TatC [Pseudoflavonifractor sp.]